MPDVFTPEDRATLRTSLVAAARADREVVGAALVGSAATGREDAWSDIDLALQISGDVHPSQVAARWTAELYDRHGAAHHLDVMAGDVLYRVFLLASSLQVDVSFWPRERFRATSPGFALLFGTPAPPTEPSAAGAAHEIGMAWLYALHARSAIARGRTWQAVMMLDHLRDQVLVLGCLQAGLTPHHGRDADRLPAALLHALTLARATSTSTSELARSHRALVDILGEQVSHHDPDLSHRLAAPLDSLARIDA